MQLMRECSLFMTWGRVCVCDVEGGITTYSHGEGEGEFFLAYFEGGGGLFSMHYFCDFFVFAKVTLRVLQLL